jgi:hypothetical protein
MFSTRCFISVIKISKHQYYYQFKTQNKVKPKFISVYIGLDGLEMTILNTRNNQHFDSLRFGYRLWTSNDAALKLIGYQINYKKYID